MRPVSHLNVILRDVRSECIAAQSHRVLVRVMVDLSDDFLDLEDGVPSDSGLQAMEIVVLGGAIRVQVDDVSASLEGDNIAREPLVAIFLGWVFILHVRKVVLVLHDAELLLVLIRRLTVLQLPYSTNSKHFRRVISRRARNLMLRLLGNFFPNEGHLDEGDGAFVELPLHAVVLSDVVHIRVGLHRVVVDAAVSPSFACSVRLICPSCLQVDHRYRQKRCNQRQKFIQVSESHFDL